MRIVLDTNVIISGTFWDGVCHRVLEKISLDTVNHHTSIDILQEYERILQSKFKVSGEELKRRLALIINFSTIIKPNIEVNICRDKKDNIILECAVSADAKYIITGDEDLLVLKKFQKIKIVSPREFLDICKTLN
jgi:uncharacterized protein